MRSHNTVLKCSIIEYQKCYSCDQTYSKQKFLDYFSLNISSSSCSHPVVFCQLVLALFSTGKRSVLSWLVTCLLEDHQYCSRQTRSAHHRQNHDKSRARTWTEGNSFHYGSFNWENSFMTSKVVYLSNNIPVPMVSLAFFILETHNSSRRVHACIFLSVLCKGRRRIIRLGRTSGAPNELNQPKAVERHF